MRCPQDFVFRSGVFTDTETASLKEKFITYHSQEKRACHVRQSHVRKNPPSGGGVAVAGGGQCQEAEEARRNQRPRTLVAAPTRRNG